MIPAIASYGNSERCPPIELGDEVTNQTTLSMFQRIYIIFIFQGLSYNHLFQTPINIFIDRRGLRIWPWLRIWPGPGPKWLSLGCRV